MNRDANILPVAFDRKTNKWRPVYGSGPIVKTGSLKLVTYNIWFGDHFFKQRLSAIAGILKATKADIIALQEVTENGLKLLLKHDWVKKNYFISDTSGATFYSYGVVLLSRIPFKRLELHPLTSMMGRYLLTAEFNINGQMLLVATTHLESLRHSEKIRSVQLNEIFSLLNRSENSLLLGDLNFCSSWEENNHLDPGYSDVWQVLKPEAPGYTEDTDINIMRKALKREEQKVRFDRILLRNSKAVWRPKKINRIGMEPISTQHPKVFPSDHFGLFCILDWCSE